VIVTVVCIGTVYWGRHWLFLGFVAWAVIVFVPWFVRHVGDRDLRSPP